MTSEQGNQSEIQLKHDREPADPSTIELIKNRIRELMIGVDIIDKKGNVFEHAIEDFIVSDVDSEANQSTRYEIYYSKAIDEVSGEEKIHEEFSFKRSSSVIIDNKTKDFFSYVVNLTQDDLDLDSTNKALIVFIKGPDDEVVKIIENFPEFESEFEHYIEILGLESEPRIYQQINDDLIQIPPSRQIASNKVALKILSELNIAIPTREYK